MASSLSHASPNPSSANKHLEARMTDHVRGIQLVSAILRLLWRKETLLRMRCVKQDARECYVKSVTAMAAEGISFIAFWNDNRVATVDFFIDLVLLT